MRKQNSLFVLVVIISLLLLPSAVSLSYYYITKDPSVRPLGITEDSLLSYFGGGDGLEIVALVDWDSRGTGEMIPQEFERALIKAFQARGVDVRVEFYSSASETQVRYQIGPSLIGPFSRSHAAAGVTAAVAAYRMNIPVQE